MVCLSHGKSYDMAVVTSHDLTKPYHIQVTDMNKLSHEEQSYGWRESKYKDDKK